MSDNKPFIDVRAVFEKKDAAIFFSHLDLSRTVARAMRRSKQDIWMSQGFTPRPHLVFTPPLSLGYESECEMMDFRLNLGATLDRAAFENAFPDTLKIKDVYFPKTKLKDIAFAKYRILIDTDSTPKDIVTFFDGPVMMLKKTKRSEQTVDITQFIKKLECTASDTGVVIETVLDLSGTSTLSPSYVIDALIQGGTDIRKSRVRRLEFLDADMNTFR